MKTENLTFIEAVQALKDGKAESFRHSEWVSPQGVCLLDGWRLMWTKSDQPAWIPVVEQVLSAGFTLVNPIVETEEREVTSGQWGIVNTTTGRLSPHSLFPSKEKAEESIKNVGFAAVELTGTYRVPVKEKEKKRVEATGKVSLNIADCLYLDHLLPAECCGKSGKISFEWED